MPLESLFSFSMWEPSIQRHFGEKLGVWEGGREGLASVACWLRSGKLTSYVICGKLTSYVTCLLSLPAPKKHPGSSAHGLPHSPRGFQGLGFTD